MEFWIWKVQLYYNKKVLILVDCIHKISYIGTLNTKGDLCLITVKQTKPNGQRSRTLSPFWEAGSDQEGNP